jgi:hypothetical protein
VHDTDSLSNLGLRIWAPSILLDETQKQTYLFNSGFWRDLNPFTRQIRLRRLSTQLQGSMALKIITDTNHEHVSL